MTTIRLSPVEIEVRTHSPHNPLAVYLYTKLDAKAEQVEQVTMVGVIAASLSTKFATN